MYLDGVIVYLKFAAEHLVQVRPVLTLLQNARVTLHLSQCYLMDNTVSYLRHAIRSGKLAVDNKKCEAVRRSLLSTNGTELRSYLGIGNFRRPLYPALLDLLACGTSERNRITLLSSN